MCFAAVLAALPVAKSWCSYTIQVDLTMDINTLRSLGFPLIAPQPRKTLSACDKSTACVQQTETHTAGNDPTITLNVTSNNDLKWLGRAIDMFAICFFFCCCCQLAVSPGFCWQLMITNDSFLDLLITWVWFAFSCCKVWSKQKAFNPQRPASCRVLVSTASAYAENYAADNISAKCWQLISRILGLPGKQMDASFSLVHILGCNHTTWKAEHSLQLTLWP